MNQPNNDPPMTLPDGKPLAEVEAAWTAAYCKPRQEKALARDLYREGVPYFLPMIRRITSSRGRRRSSLHPMFKSYLFLAPDDQQRLAALKTERIVSFVSIHDAQQPTFRGEIASLELGLTQAPDTIDLYPRLVEGAWVRVIGGPMEGAEGVVLQAKNKTKLLLGVTIMGAGATVEIHPDLVEPWERDPQPCERPKVEVVYDIQRRTGGG